MCPRSLSMRPTLGSMAISLVCLLVSEQSAATELTVRVGGIEASKGAIGCALFSGASGFPLDNAQALQSWLPAQSGGVACRFPMLQPGRYAVAVSHDLNGNRRLDTNFFGIPVEAWGVSNNVRPTLRSPRFDEAAFTLGADQALVIEVQVAK